MTVRWNPSCFGGWLTPSSTAVRDFPLSDEMAREWAAETSSCQNKSPSALAFLQAMEGLIRYENLTNAPKLGSLVTLVPVKSENQTITLEDVKVRGVTNSERMFHHEPGPACPPGKVFLPTKPKWPSSLHAA